jgi:hypothetical protein
MSCNFVQKYRLLEKATVLVRAKYDSAGAEKVSAMSRVMKAELPHETVLKTYQTYDRIKTAGLG